MLKDVQRALSVALFQNMPIINLILLRVWESVRKLGRSVKQGVLVLNYVCVTVTKNVLLYKYYFSQCIIALNIFLTLGIPSIAIYQSLPAGHFDRNAF